MLGIIKRWNPFHLVNPSTAYFSSAQCSWSSSWQHERLLILICSGPYLLEKKPGLIAKGLDITGWIYDCLLFNNTELWLDWFQIRKLILISIAYSFATLPTPRGYGTWEILTKNARNYMDQFDLDYHIRVPCGRKSYLRCPSCHDAANLPSNRLPHRSNWDN